MTTTDSIPEPLRPSVMQAVQVAFGASAIDDVRQMTAGLSSALVFRIVVRGTPYLLRLIQRTDAWADPTRQVGCMAAAADAGIAPQIRYMSVEKKILITDFIEGRPLPDDAALLMASVVRTLHSLPGFPAGINNYFETLDGFVNRCCSAKLLPEALTEPLYQGYAKTSQAFLSHPLELVASHNDLKPDNTIFDGERVWVVDWEAAFLNDRYVDLAIVANFFVRGESAEQSFLSTYFGRPASDYERARFCLMRQILHTFYVALLMVLADRSGERIDPDLPAEDFDDFHRGMLAGTINLSGAPEKRRYARIHLDRVLVNFQTQHFADALALVSSRTTHRTPAPR